VAQWRLCFFSLLAPMVEVEGISALRTQNFRAIVDEMVGRWAGDEIAVVGDYAEDTDLPLQHRAGSIYRRCLNGEFRDISDDILPVVEFACDVRITGADWRKKERRWVHGT